MSDSMLGVLSELTSSDESSRAALRQSLERLDILVCGKCSKVFHSVHDFRLATLKEFFISSKLFP
jgi:hypothetical protein